MLKAVIPSAATAPKIIRLMAIGLVVGFGGLGIPAVGGVVGDGVDVGAGVAVAPGGGGDGEGVGDVDGV